MLSIVLYDTYVLKLQIHNNEQKYSHINRTMAYLHPLCSSYIIIAFPTTKVTFTAQILLLLPQGAIESTMKYLGAFSLSISTLIRYYRTKYIMDLEF